MAAAGEMPVPWDRAVSRARRWRCNVLAESRRFPPFLQQRHIPVPGAPASSRTTVTDAVTPAITDH